MNIGDKLYHWRFGPLSVLTITDEFITVSVDEPTGLVGTRLEAIPSKIKLSSMGSYFHNDPRSVYVPHNMDDHQSHNYFRNKGFGNFTETRLFNNNVPINPKTIVKTGVNPNDVRKEIEDYTNTIIELKEKMNKLQISVSKEEKNQKIFDEELSILESKKEEIIQKEKQVDSDIEKTKKEIADIRILISPRELKKRLPELPNLENRLLMLESDKRELYEMKNKQGILIATQQDQIINVEKMLMEINKEISDIKEKVIILSNKRDTLQAKYSWR